MLKNRNGTMKQNRLYRNWQRTDYCWTALSCERTGDSVTVYRSPITSCERTGDSVTVYRSPITTSTAFKSLCEQHLSFIIEYNWEIAQTHCILTQGHTNLILCNLHERQTRHYCFHTVSVLPLHTAWNGAVFVGLPS